jgi:hypothetical protein
MLALSYCLYVRTLYDSDEIPMNFSEYLSMCTRPGVSRGAFEPDPISLFTEVPRIRILRSSDAGSCINRPSAAAETASKGLHTACQSPHLVVVHEDAGRRILRLWRAPSFCLKYAEKPLTPYIRSRMDRVEDCY